RPNPDLTRRRHNLDVGIMHRAPLAVTVRPQLLNRPDQSRRPIGDDQHWRPQPAADKVATHLQPVLEALRLTEPSSGCVSKPAWVCRRGPSRLTAGGLPTTSQSAHVKVASH